MTNSSKFIKDYTKGCSNELYPFDHHSWLTPEEAEVAVEIDRRELIDFACNWLTHNTDMTYLQVEDFRTGVSKFGTEVV